jgi:peptide deformylase
MAVREILKMGDARLLRVAQPVPAFDTPELHALVADLQDTMAAANGAGIAAPQIGVDLQVVIFGSGRVNPRYPDAPPVPFTVLVNPRITPIGDAMGQPIDREVSGFHARVVQHECDHLWGKLYPMRITDFTHFGFTEVLFPELAVLAQVPVED